MIFFVAPYDGRPPKDSPFMASAKKILTIINALIINDEKVILINSGHQGNERKEATLASIDIYPDNKIEVYTPDTMDNAWVGRLRNILNADKIMNELVRRFGKPELIWLYNGYAFEMRMAKLAKKKYNIKTVIEFEDWHFARKRGLNPKPYIDWFYWRLAVKYIDHGYVVNNRLAEHLKKFKIPTTLLPGIVTKNISEIAKIAPPFLREEVTLGYFGGLTEEKGVGVLLRLVKRTNAHIKFIVTGRGELAHECAELSATMPERFQYLGAVSEEELSTAISKADLILNAHTVNDGVFPFKIIEALASGRLLISTQLPTTGYEAFAKAIQFYDGSESELIRLVEDSRSIYQVKKSAIIDVADFVSLSYGGAAIIEKIREYRQSIMQ